jgi:hypothetical protein
MHKLKLYICIDKESANSLELGLGILSEVFRGWGREEFRSEHSGLLHVALDLHFTLTYKSMLITHYSHESSLRVKGSLADSNEIFISHGESGVDLVNFILSDTTLSGLEVNDPSSDDGASLLFSDFKGIDSVNFFNEMSSISRVQKSTHHFKELVALEGRSRALLGRLRFLLRSTGGGTSVLSEIFRGWGREEVRGEHGGLLHVALDLHLALKN